MDYPRDRMPCMRPACNGHLVSRHIRRKHVKLCSNVHFSSEISLMATSMATETMQLSGFTVDSSFESNTEVDTVVEMEDQNEPVM